MLGFRKTQGGLGGGPAEFGIIMEEFGRALVVEPSLQTVVIGGGCLLQRQVGHGDEELIAKIIRGDAVLAFAFARTAGPLTWRDVRTSARQRDSGYVLDGHKAVVIAAPFATHLLVTARTGGSPARARRHFRVPRRLQRAREWRHATTAPSMVEERRR